MNPPYTSFPKAKSLAPGAKRGSDTSPERREHETLAEPEVLRSAILVRGSCRWFLFAPVDSASSRSTTG